MVVLNEPCGITHTGKLFVVLSWEHFYILPWSRHYLMLIHVVIHLLSKQKKSCAIIELLAIKSTANSGGVRLKLLQNVGMSVPRVYSRSTL